jgi:uncharacterized protein (UPF0264 family)
MTAFLASVTSVDEARIVLECGADIIDLKNPYSGALGALPLATVREIVRFVDGRKPVSATIGDLPMQPSLLLDAAGEMAGTGVDIVKIGFFEPPAEIGQYEACVHALGVLTQSVRLVAVMFADLKFQPAIKDFAAAGFYGVMLDTATKSGLSLGDLYTPEQLHDFVRQAHDYSLLAGLAGALKAHDIPEMALHKPDYLGFRGALCENAMRTMAIERGKARHLRQLLRECNRLVECTMV